MSRHREIRRHAGVLAVGLGRMGLGRVGDPRSDKSRKWPLPQLLTAALAGLMAGCKTLRRVEELTEMLSPPVRRRLGIWRRVPDTTLRDLLMKFAGRETDLRAVLHRQNRIAWRKKQLRPEGLPCSVIAIDGKHTATDIPDDVYAQRQEEGRYVVRSLTASLVSAPAATCLDMWPIPEEQSESSAFGPFVEALVAAYGRSGMLEVITSDSGIGDEPNARLLDDRGFGYVFAIKGDQPTLLDEATRLLGNLPASMAEAETVDRIDNQTVLIRRVWSTTKMAGYHWDHLRVALRVEAVRVRDDGTVLTREERYFVSNVPRARFTPEQWLRVVRWHWRVENSCHQTWDVAFEEDDRPWITAAAGMLIVQILRRIAYNVLVLYRNVSRRGEDKGGIPWQRLLGRIYVALVAAGEVHLRDLRWPTPPRATSRPPPDPSMATA